MKKVLTSSLSIFVEKLDSELLSKDEALLLTGGFSANPCDTTNNGCTINKGCVFNKKCNIFTDNKCAGE